MSIIKTATQSSAITLPTTDRPLLGHGVRISGRGRGVRISGQHGVRISNGVRISRGVRISSQQGVRISAQQGVRIS
jgi:hypothetical protein